MPQTRQDGEGFLLVVVATVSFLQLGGGRGAATFNNRRHKKVGEKRLFSCWLPVAIGPSGFLLIIIMIAINI